jgi:hypothetical protein
VSAAIASPATPARQPTPMATIRLDPCRLTA